MTQVQVVRWLFPVMCWLLPKWSRRRVYLAACGIGSEVVSKTWAIREPATWWKYRRVIRNARRGVCVIEA